MERTALYFNWDQQGDRFRRRYRSGVSLHGHTLHSRESLDFIPRIARRVPGLHYLVSRGAARYRKAHGVELDFARAWWTPPLSPRQALQVEQRQIETSLDVQPLVSLTDHDNIEAAGRLLLAAPAAEPVISVEWTVPWAPTFFHIGVHNLPAAAAHGVMRSLAEFTAAPRPPRLLELLEWLNRFRSVLIVLNHPLWDEKGIGEARHRVVASELVKFARPWIHALELNGLRPWAENHDVVPFARLMKLPFISGGDRHGLEPNATLNLSYARNFEGFVEEVREQGLSHVVFMRQYRDCYSMRVIHTIADVLADHPDHGLGWRSWTDRVFYQPAGGSALSLSQLWNGRVPAPVKHFVEMVRLLKHPPVRRFLRFALGASEKAGAG